MRGCSATRATQDDDLKYLNKQDYGRVPTYLLERKIELAAQQEAEERMKEAALIPPGVFVGVACVQVTTEVCQVSLSTNVPSPTQPTTTKSLRQLSPKHSKSFSFILILTQFSLPDFSDFVDVPPLMQACACCQRRSG